MRKFGAIVGTVALAVTAVVLTASPASAAQVQFSLAGGGPGSVMPNSQWQNITVNDTSSGVFVNDASINPDSEAVPGGLAFSQGDAYDGAGNIKVDGTTFHPTNLSQVTSTIAGDGTGQVNTGPGF